jgi:hypothetical protein
MFSVSWRNSHQSARASSLSWLHDHTHWTHHTLYDSSGQVIVPSQGSLSYNTQHSRETCSRWDSNPQIPRGQRPHIHALCYATTRICVDRHVPYELAMLILSAIQLIKSMYKIVALTSHSRCISIKKAIKLIIALWTKRSFQRWNTSLPCFNVLRTTCLLRPFKQLQYRQLLTCERKYVEIHVSSVRTALQDVSYYQVNKNERQRKNEGMNRQDRKKKGL